MMLETLVNGNPVTVFNGEGILNDDAHNLQGSEIWNALDFNYI